MFEQADTTLPHSLGAQGVSDWKDQLARSITQPSGLDDAERIDTIRSLEELVCVATAPRRRR